MPTTKTLTWTKSPDLDVAKYNIYRAVGSAPTKDAGHLYASVPSSASTYVDTITADGDYFYAVSAVDTSNNESALSNIKDVVVDITPPQPPSSLNVA